MKNLRKIIALNIVFIAVFGVFLLLGSHNAFAATYTVTNTDDSGAGSLRQAVDDANNNVGHDQIDFNIGAGVQTITLGSTINVSDPVKINGLSASGSACNGTSSTLKVVIENNVIGLGVGAAGTEINGLVFGQGNALIADSADNAIIRCNFFGTNAAGTAAVSSGSHGGVYTYGVSGTTIGGDAVTDMNLFGKYAIHIEGTSQTIKNNIVGTDITGTMALGIDDYGAILLTNVSNTVVSNNLVSGATGSGIHFYYGTDSGNTIKGNKIGTNYAGTAALPNSGAGISSWAAHSNEMIGGPNEADRNIISGNSDYAIKGLSIGVTIQNNFIGTNAAGDAAIPNAVGVGIDCGDADCSSAHIIDNVISGNGNNGLYLGGIGNHLGAVVQGNHIGTDITNTLDLGNELDGIFVGTGGDSGRFLIGGTGANEGNTIRFNGGHGIGVNYFSGGKASLLGNSISDNGLLGISLGSFGSLENGLNHTVNDSGDGDTGPNDLLNYPIVTQATDVSGHTNLNFDLDVPAGDYRIEFFSNTEADPSGYGEGETYLGYEDITSTGTGSQSFTTSVSGTGHTHLAATATLIDGDSPSGFGPTSEFGKFEPVTDLEVASDDGVTTVHSGDSNTYTFTVTNNGPSAIDHFRLNNGDFMDEPTFEVIAEGSTASDTGSFSGNAWEKDWDGTLETGQTLVFQIHGVIGGDNYGDIHSSRACVANLEFEGNNTSDSNEENNCGTDDDTNFPAPVADGEITKTLNSPGTITNGQQATYKLTYTNHGPDVGGVNPFYIYDLLPPGLTFASATDGGIHPLGDDGIYVPCDSNPEQSCWIIGSAGSSPWASHPGSLIYAVYIGGQTIGQTIGVGESVSLNITVDVADQEDGATVINWALLFAPSDSDPEAGAIEDSYETEGGPFDLVNNDITHHTYNPNVPPDGDLDGVTNAVESAGPNNGDANDDGITDADQPNVASYVDSVTGQYVVVESSCPVVSGAGVVAESSDDPDADYSYPAGLVNFTTNCSTPGSEATITQYYYGSFDPTKLALRKWNPNTHTYTSLEDVDLSSVTVGGHSAIKAVYQITDGSSLDQDGIANGTIVDLVGPALSADGSSSGSSNESRSTSSAKNSSDDLADTGDNTGVVITAGVVLLLAGVTSLTLWVKTSSPRK